MRRIFIPPEGMEDVVALFSLGKHDVAKLERAVTSPARSPVDEILHIINGLRVTDEVATSLFGVCHYLARNMSEAKIDASSAAGELAALLSESSEAGAKKAAENLTRHKQAFESLLSSITSESTVAKRRYLASQTFNSVSRIHSICDLRPVFSRDRSRIEDMLMPVLLEFTVIDSVGDSKVIQVSLDEKAFEALKEEVSSATRKQALLAETFKTQRRST